MDTKMAPEARAGAIVAASCRIGRAGAARQRTAAVHHAGVGNRKPAESVGVGGENITTCKIQQSSWAGSLAQPPVRLSDAGARLCTAPPLCVCTHEALRAAAEPAGGGTCAAAARTKQQGRSGAIRQGAAAKERRGLRRCSAPVQSRVRADARGRRVGRAEQRLRVALDPGTPAGASWRPSWLGRKW